MGGDDMNNVFRMSFILILYHSALERVSTIDESIIKIYNNLQWQDFITISSCN